jgi:hypothetical protein
MQLTHPDPGCEIFADIPLDERHEINRWVRAFASVDFQAGIGRALAWVARVMGCDEVTARRKYDALRKSNGHWTALADGRRIRRLLNEERTGNREFRNFITGLAERHQRNSKAAYRKFISAWAARETIPGFEDFPGWPNAPFTYRTFARIVQAETDGRKLASIRVSTSSKSGASLAQVFTTRVGLYPGAVYQFDDVWHDNWVTLGRDPVPKRVLELGVLDLFSGCRFHWGCKPRMPKAGGGMENLKEREMRFFVAGVLWNFGTSPQGTRFMVEHGTAAIREDIISILADSGLGISVDHQPIEGRQMALTGFWKGSEGGNFRAKAALESVHNLMHNDLGHLAMQTGSPSSGLKGPITTERQIAYITKIISDVLKKVPHRAELLRLPSLDYHSQFLPFLNDYYQIGLNGRTDHELEGWEKLGFLATEYTAVPGSGQFLSSPQFLALPDSSQAIIREAARMAPEQWTRRRMLSPGEVWKTGRGDLRRAPAPLICDILGKDLGREVTVRGSYIRFRDQDISPDEMIYQARARHLNGAQRELRDGEKFFAFANPFAPGTLFLLDANDRYLGHCALEQRVTATDRAALINAAGEKARRNADILQPLRIRHAEQVGDYQEMREHNKRVVSGAPVTPDEIRDARQSSARDGVRTRKANAITAAIGAEAMDPEMLLQDDCNEPEEVEFTPPGFDPFDAANLLDPDSNF